MKMICLGDTHGRDVWKEIVKQHPGATFLFVGDYFDSFDIPFLQQMNNFKEIMKFKEDNFDRVITLIGNHEQSYLPAYIQSGDNCAGFQASVCLLIRDELYINMKNLQVAYKMDDILFTHAGITKTWLKDHKIENDDSLVDVLNDHLKYKPFTFAYQEGGMGYGNEIFQGPLWVRPPSLQKDGIRNYIQIVGHTPVNRIDIQGKATGKKFYFIDCLHKKIGNEYLIIENGEIKLGKI